MPGLDPGIRASTACSMGDPASPPSSCADLFRASISALCGGATWMAATSAAMTSWGDPGRARQPLVVGAGEKCPRGASLKLLTLVAKNGLGTIA